jgi:oligopeptidase B
MTRPNHAGAALRFRRLLFLGHALVLTLPTLLVAQDPQDAPRPPVAEVRPHQVTAPHGHVRTDPYYWMRDREDEQVLSYLRAENEYTQARMAHTQALQERIFEEIRGRIVETDMSVPYRRGDYWYYSRSVEGQEHSIHARRRGSMDAPEEILLDENERAVGKPYYSSNLSVSPNDRLLAFAEDTIGRNIVTIRFRDLATGQLLPDVIERAGWALVWAEDNRTLFYTTRDPVTLRTNKVWRHTLGEDPANAVLVWEETDETFSTGVYKTRSRQHIVIGSFHSLSQEFRYAPADQPAAGFRVFMPRERGHEHSLDELDGWFYVRTNEGGAKNFKLMRTRVETPGREHWQEVIPHRVDVYLAGSTLFRDHLVLSERRDGLMQLRIRPWSGDGEHYVAFDEEAYVVFPSANPEADTRTLRFSYQSMTTPSTIYDYDMATRDRTLLKRTEVLGGYDPAEYRTQRILVTARDGTPVPVIMVYRRDLRRDGPQPLLLYGYGSYGISMDPSFSSIRLSLLDRGFIYAIAQVRGGQEFGRDWYESGRLMNKLNTFTDFIDAAQHLVQAGYTAPSQLYAQGGSAGGLLVGAVINMAPELFHGAVANVPFVDVVTTMLDETIPLTTFEWDEWGDPRKPDFYEYMLAYSPYDQVTTQRYPHLLVTSGLHDSQVQYFEPTKWVARMRALNPDGNRILLRTNMEAGHGGAAGRYQRWREIAFEYSFLLDLAGLAEREPVGPSAGVRQRTD